jgi:hypothetical protein
VPHGGKSLAVEWILEIVAGSIQGSVFGRLALLVVGVANLAIFFGEVLTII